LNLNYLLQTDIIFNTVFECSDISEKLSDSYIVKKKIYNRKGVVIIN